MYFSDVKLGATQKRKLVARYIPKKGVSLSEYITERQERKKEQKQIDNEEQIKAINKDIKSLKARIKVLIKYPDANKTKILAFENEINDLNKLKLKYD